MFSCPRTAIGDEAADVFAHAIDSVRAELIAGDVEVVVPASLVLDVLLTPVGQVVRNEFRDFCLSNLAALPGVDDLNRERLRRLVVTGG